MQPTDFAVFQDHGYKGLYGGLAAKDIHAKKSLQKGQKILDHLPELFWNLPDSQPSLARYRYHDHAAELETAQERRPGDRPVVGERAPARRDAREPSRPDLSRRGGTHDGRAIVTFLCVAGAGG